MSDSTQAKSLPKPIVLFDGSCNLCVTTTTQLRALDNEGAIDWMDLNQTEVRARFPKIDWKRAEEEMHLVHMDGRVVTGSRAVADICQIIGGDVGRSASQILQTPGIREAADLVYKVVAENRHRISAALGAKPKAG